jgi:hypothetical protein
LFKIPALNFVPNHSAKKDKAWNFLLNCSVTEERLEFHTKPFIKEKTIWNSFPNSSNSREARERSATTGTPATAVTSQPQQNYTFSDK